MDELNLKIGDIKEKIKLLASKIEDLRSQNFLLFEENKKLRAKLRQNEEEMNLLRQQLSTLLDVGK